MISDSKFVKGVKSNAPKKGYKIEWQDGKFDNIFDESWLPMLDEAQKTNRLVTYEKEKNNAGYWNIINLYLAELDEEPQEDLFPDEAVPEKGTSVPKKGTETADARQHDIHRQVALKCVVDLTCHGFMELGKLKQNTEMLLHYLDTGE